MRKTAVLVMSKLPPPRLAQYAKPVVKKLADKDDGVRQQTLVTLLSIRPSTEPSDTAVASSERKFLSAPVAGRVSILMGLTATSERPWSMLSSISASYRLRVCCMHLELSSQAIWALVI